MARLSWLLTPVALGFWLGVQGFAPPLVVPGGSTLVQRSGYSATAATLAEIQARGYLVVAVKDNLRPLGFRDEAGELVGLEIDLAHRLAEELLGDRSAIVFQPVSNPERLSLVMDGSVDMAIARVTVTDTRARLVDFSTPYYLDGTGFITRNPAIRTVDDLADTAVAVLYGSDTIPTVRSLLPSVRLVGVESYQEAQTLLESGGAVAFAADASVLTGWAQTDSDYRVLPALISAEALSVVMPRGLQYEELRQRVNQAIRRWHLDGWLQERIRYWGLP
jgi:polar amino acid transport system substrate-binding protein